MTTGYAGRAARAVGLAGAFAGLVIGLVVSSASVRPVGAANAQPKEKEYAKAPDSHKLIGAAVCQDCHDREDPTKVNLYKQTLGFEFIRLWENRVWGAYDLHANAYKNLLTSRTAKKGTPNKTAQKMEDNLRKYKGENYFINTDTACLACHASTKEPIKQAPPNKWTAASFDTIDGVGCEMCHGHGSAYQGKHQDSVPDETNAPEGAVRFVEWRDWPLAQKEKWGLVNLRDSASAATKCASCHIGNKDEGRFVTHDMYAAGHPPLPPLDLMAYSREQPRHWGLASEMPYITKLAKKDAKKAQDLFHYRADESFVARRFAESTLAILGATATLGAHLADEAKAKDDGLDYAAFDCYSCHHNLKYPSERQDRGYIGRPGRPLYRPAAFALAKVVVGHAEALEGSDLKGALDALNKAELELADAFTAKSYGDPVKIKAATDKLTKWSAETRKKLATVKYTPDATKKLLDRVVAATQQPIGDPEAAQLYLWAFETLELDLNAPADKKEPPKTVVALREKIKDVVVTRLRPKTAYYYEQGRDTPSPDALESVSDRIGPRMDLFNSFRADPFRKAFQDVKTAPK